GVKGRFARAIDGRTKHVGKVDARPGVWREISRAGDKSQPGIALCPDPAIIVEIDAGTGDDRAESCATGGTEYGAGETRKVHAGGSRGSVITRPDEQAQRTTGISPDPAIVAGGSVRPDQRCSVEGDAPAGVDDGAAEPGKTDVAHGSRRIAAGAGDKT